MMKVLASKDALDSLRTLVQQEEYSISIIEDVFEATHALLEQNVVQAKDNLLLLAKDDVNFRHAFFVRYAEFFLESCSKLSQSGQNSLLGVLKQLELYLVLAKLDQKESRLSAILKCLYDAPINDRTADVLLFPLQLIAVSERKKSAIFKLLDCASHIQCKQKLMDTLRLAKQLNCELEIIGLTAYQSRFGQDAEGWVDEILERQ